MRVQHVWAKTGTSPVAFHNTTGDVALCPASEHRPGRRSPKIKGRKSSHIERTGPTLASPCSPGLRGATIPGGRASPRGARLAVRGWRDSRSGRPAARLAGRGSRSRRVSRLAVGAVRGCGAHLTPPSAWLLRPIRPAQSKPGAFATLETLVAARLVASWSRRAASRPRVGGSHDRVSKVSVLCGRGRHRAPLRALYDSNYAQSPLCPVCLSCVVTVRTLWRCPLPLAIPR